MYIFLFEEIANRMKEKKKRNNQATVNLQREIKVKFVS